jgi:hypothetical protein
MHDTNNQSAASLMNDFSVRTGVVGYNDSSSRYLWTDAFAVITFLALRRSTGNQEYLNRAVHLVDLVHHVLGCHRRDDRRTGWISGLSKSEGESRPTAGGLRIGKPLPERRAGDPLDERLEWQRDGQYFHYLTKWMHALSLLSRETGDPKWNTQATDLAMTAFAAFVNLPRPGAMPRMCWKMSIDLSRPLVPFMGQLDPLDGFVSFCRLQSTARRFGLNSLGLDNAIAVMRRACGNDAVWATADPLSIGGLLGEASQLAELIASGDMPFDRLLTHLVADIQRSLEDYMCSGDLTLSFEKRLAFRELGLSIGLQAIETMREAVRNRPGRFGGEVSAASLLSRLDSMTRYLPLIEHIEDFWCTPAVQASAAWAEHRDINSVMLANSLVRMHVSLPIDAKLNTGAAAARS